MIMAVLERTQIYLPSTLKRKLKQTAEARNRTFSDIVREFLEEQVDEKARQKNKVNPWSNLLRAAREAEEKGYRGPSDLSTNHDYYLYVEPYEDNKKKDV
jgi:predicted transcriptional regulator